MTAEISLTNMILQEKEIEFVKKLNIKNQLKYTKDWIYKFK